MLGVVAQLASELDLGGIRYCHWKSNRALTASVRGEGDLDLLVHREDVARFRWILARLGFSPVVDAINPPFPGVEHWYAVDPDSAAIVHVHAYYRVVTGQSLVKNYRLPLEGMLLGSARDGEAGLRVPGKGAELIVFAIRMLIKHTSPFELVLLRRQWKAVRREASWLVDASALSSARELLPAWLPQLDVGTFERAVRAVAEPAHLWKRVALGYRIRRRLRPFARHGVIRTHLVETRKFLSLVSHRLQGTKKGLTPATGGAVIAFVGSEASGKSTLADEARAWLGGRYTVRRIHAGKPPGTLLTWLPNLLVPLMRRLAPSSRSTVVEARIAGSANANQRAVSPLFALRSVSLAWDRRALLSQAHADAANGRIVLCDRYPSTTAGAIDGPQLDHVLDASSQPSWLRRLARLEARLYEDVPPPDMVIHVSASLETTLERNRARDKTEPEPYVRRRYERGHAVTFDRAPVRRVDTDGPLEQSLRRVKMAIWETL